MEDNVKKVIIVLSFISIIFISFAYSEDYGSDSSGDGDVFIPPGMEVIKRGDVNIVVPKGGQLRKQDSVMLIETADEYASRKFMDADERFKKIEKELQVQKKEIEDLKSAVKKTEEYGREKRPVSHRSLP